VLRRLRGPDLAPSTISEDFEAPAAIQALAGVYSADPDVLLPGGSASSAGRHWIAGPVGDEETIVLADLDPSLLAGEYQALDSAGRKGRRRRAGRLRRPRAASRPWAAVEP